jgi:hypothetical protein
MSLIDRILAGRLACAWFTMVKAELKSRFIARLRTRFAA